MFTIDSMLPILKNDNPSSISITKEALDSLSDCALSNRGVSIKN